MAAGRQGASGATGAWAAVWHVTAVVEPGDAVVRYHLEATLDVDDSGRTTADSADPEAVLAALHEWLARVQDRPRA